MICQMGGGTIDNWKSISLGLSTYLASCDFSKRSLAFYLRYGLSVLLLSTQHNLDRFLLLQLSRMTTV